jgi:hypothetical protein
MSSLVGAEKQLSIVVLPVPNIPTSCKCVAASLCDPKGVNTFGEGSIDPRYRLSCPLCYYLWSKIRGRIQRKTWRMQPYAVVEYNLTLCPLQSRPQHIYHGQTYAIVDPIPMPESTLSSSQGLWIWPLDQRFAEKRREKTFVTCRICYPIFIKGFFRRDTIWLRSVREQTWNTLHPWTN